MPFTNSETFFYVLAFIVPGFIVQWVLSGFVPTRKEEVQISLLRAFILSCLNYAIWCWLIFIIYSNRWINNPTWLAAFCLFLIVFVSPLGIGLILGRLSRSAKFASFLEKMKLDVMHAIPNSWDYTFGRKQESWILVTLTDGGTISGWFGTKSFASSEPTERDLYIEQVWDNDEEGGWQKRPRTGGILILSSQIRYIEFLVMEEENA